MNTMWKKKPGSRLCKPGRYTGKEMMKCILPQISEETIYSDKDGGMSLELRVHQNMKIVEVWLTQKERKNKELQEQLVRMYREYTAKKYKVAQFHSGSDDLYAATRALLLFNRKRIAELENLREKSPNLTGSYSGGVSIQC